MQTTARRERSGTRTRLLMSAPLVGSLVAGCASSGGTDADGTEVGGGDVAPIGIPSGDDVQGFGGGVVAAANPLAAQAGARVLADGGNAVDAAVVVQFVLNVVEPTSSGIGGGGFMGIHLPAEGRTFFIDSREKAPAAAAPTQYLACDPNCTGEDFDAEGGPGRIGSDVNPDVGFTDIATSGIAVGVPGTLLGAQQALRDYGTLTLAEALAPAIDLAANGFEVNERLATLIAEPAENNRTTFWPETSAVFRPGGTPLVAGDTLVQPELAATFRAIAENGVEAFYTGPIAEAIVAAQARFRDTVGPQGAGRMTSDDLAAYLAEGVDEREPITSDYRGYTIHGMPPPSSGGLTVAQILECVERFDLGDAAAGFGRGAAATLHVMVESMRLAFSSRSVWMGDDDELRLPITGLLADDYLAPRCAQIGVDSRIPDEEIVPGDPRQFDPDFPDVTPSAVGAAADGVAGVDTTHFSVIDGDGIVVSWTSTIEGTWGTGMIVPGYGFLLNNELTDFNFTPQRNDGMAEGEEFAPGANDVAPGKRPRSSMAPTLVFGDEDFLAAYGSPGGSTIINTVANVTINLIDHGLSVQEAIDAPRISANGPSPTVAHEEGFDAAALQALRDLGHTLRDEPGDIGSVQAVVVDPVTGTRYGGADDRRAGDVQGLPARR